MIWIPTTDDDLPYPEIPELLYAGMRDIGAGQIEVSGYPKEDDELRAWTVVVAEGPNGEHVAAHIDWQNQSIVTAWRPEEAPHES